MNVVLMLCSFQYVFAKEAPLNATVSDEMVPIPLTDVKVEGEIGRRIDLTINKNLLALDVENVFLKPFKEKRSEGTWEYIALGKLIDSTVRFAAYTNDNRVLELKKHLIDETIACQEPDGYIGIFTPGKRLMNLWDIHEMAYLILGMLSDYQYFGEKKSLESARKMMDYIILNWKNANPWTQAKVGLDYTALQLYKETGDEKYLNFCLKERKLSEWDKPIKLIAPSTGDEGGDGIDGHHSYAYMDECMSQLELYRIQPDEKLLEKSQNVVDFLTRENGLFVTGSCSWGECWTIDQKGSGRCEETCATAYLIRLLENKFRLEGKSLYGDMIERAIYNALFAAQSVDGRHLRYFTAFDGPREYFPIDTYCCPGNFRRIIADLPSMIYYKSGTGVTVNLYTQSQAKFKLSDIYTPGIAPVKIGNGPTLEISQQTDYPNSGKVVFTLNPNTPSKFSLSLRIPGWCQKAEITVNGEPVNDKIKPGTFFTIDRKWQPGDKVELYMPMEWQLVKGRVVNTMKVAVMRGPVLFCFDPTLNETNKKLMDAGLDKILGLNLETLPESPEDNQTVRPDGLGAKLKCWVEKGPGQVVDMEMILTEFPDPCGQVTYFPLQGLYFKNKYYGDKNVKNIDMVIDDDLIEMY